MPLHPQAQAVLDFINSIEIPPLDELEPAQFRKMMGLPAGAKMQALAKVEDLQLDGPMGPLAIRLYTPEGSGPFPIVAFYHGGGFVIGDLDSHDGWCRYIANQAGAVVAAVDYGLAPEHKFPQAPDECYAAALWLSNNAAAINGDADKLVVMGDSAGGCLAAVVCHMARSAGEPAIAHQVLAYPVTQCAFDTDSYIANAEGYFLTREMMQWFWNHYLSDASEASDPKASPLCQQKLAGLPSATLITAGYDPLLDEGVAYKDRLLEAGVEVHYRNYEGMFHGFTSFLEAIDQAGEATDFLCERISSL